MKDYYLIEKGEQTGPFSLDDLKNKNLSKESKIWVEGLENWVNAESITELKSILSKTPPPITQIETKSPPTIPQIKAKTPPTINPNINHIQKNDDYFGYEPVVSGGRFLAVLIESLVLSLPTLSVQQLELHLQVVVSLALTALLAVITYPLFSGNLGHKILGYKVISAKDGKDYNNAGLGAFREVLKSLMVFIIIPAMWLLFNKKLQNLYDIVLDTYVVKGKPNQ